MRICWQIHCSSFHSPVLMDRLQITAAVGNHNQRLKAVELLGDFREGQSVPSR